MRMIDDRTGGRLLGWMASCALCLFASTAFGEEITASVIVDRYLDANLETALAEYRQLHAHPELSLEERETAEQVAQSLESAGFTVTRDVGGTGVVGVLANGDGPIVMIRGDMDALPVSETTGLPYASRVTVTGADGRETGVMHACGHDVHTTALTSVARLMARSRAFWSGTLVVVGQPAEEIGEGALAMIEGGLFERAPKPDYLLALHVESDLPAGQVGYTPGWAFANVDAVDVVIHGRSGHGARPHRAIDPIVAGAQFVVALQTLVSRRVDPVDPAVVTVGTFHAGSKRNQIPDQARLELTVRSYTDEVRDQLLSGIRQIAIDTCVTFQCPAPPDIVVREAYTPALYNDPELTARAVAIFERAFGSESVVALPPSMGGEDFGRYSRTLGVPGLMFRVGAQPAALFAASRQEGGKALPSLHASDFAPDPGPTLSTAIRAMSLVVFDLLGPPPATP